jgi:FKBP-type peptidyl-prolyl cis-trans isomerase FklB
MSKTLALTLQTLAAVTLFLGTALAQQTPATPPPAASAPTSNAPAAQSSSSASGLTTAKDKFSYGLGMNLGMNFQRQSIPVDPDLLVRGIKDAMAGGKTLMTEDEARAALAEMQNDMRAKMEAKAKEAGDANKKEGDAFLAANKSKEGVVALPSGLQYKILKAGTGPKPTESDTVVCNYRGTLIDGKEFDSSYKRNEPATFPVNGVIKGWTEALQLMPVGSKWQLFVPSDLAYAERGAGADIGPNATLIFEVELMSIEKKEAEPAKAPEKKEPEKK